MRTFQVRDPSSYGLRVWLDGKEVTADCFCVTGGDLPLIEARGWVDLYERDQLGNFTLVSPGSVDIRWKRATGLVKWSLGG